MHEVPGTTANKGTINRAVITWYSFCGETSAHLIAKKGKERKKKRKLFLSLTYLHVFPKVCHLLFYVSLHISNALKMYSVIAHLCAFLGMFELEQA